MPPPVSLDGAALRRLIARLAPHRRALLTGLALTLIGSTAGVLQPLAAREVLQAVAGGRPLLGWVMALVGVVALAGVATAAGTLAMERSAEGVVRDARRAIVRAILRAPVLVVARHAGGDVVSRVVSDTTLLRGAAGQALSGLAGGLLTIVVSVIVMATIDPVLLATTIGVLVTCAAAFGVLLPRIARATLESQEAVAGLAARVEPVVRHLRTVQASGEQAREQAAVEAISEDAYQRGVRAARGSAIVMAGGEVAVQLAFLVALGVGGARAASGALAVPDLIAFLLYLLLLVAPIALIAVAATQLQDALAADMRLRPLESLPPERPAPSLRPGPGARTGAGPLVGLDAVRVDAAGHTILDGLTLRIPEGGTTGIVGPSGSGKTTLLELLCAFREPQGGTVRVAGRPLADWPLAQLRRTIGYVEQDAPIMPGTLRDNLRYGVAGGDDDALRAMIAELGLEQLIAAMPDGLDTPVGPGGRTLSGGERQRVAIARSLLRRPRLLLLDEASSQLDARTEVAVRRAVQVAARHCTVLTVAHRLATVLDADRIVLLDRGSVRAIGTHAELCSSDDLYRSLTRDQGLPTSPSPARA